jgi:hypothetical protein
MPNEEQPAYRRRPPLTVIVSPVIQRASSDTRNATTSAMSSGLAHSSKRHPLDHGAPVLRWVVGEQHFRRCSARRDRVNADAA